MKTLSVEGLHDFQIGRLAAMRDRMLGWAFVGYSVDLYDDYYVAADGRVRDVAYAEHHIRQADAEKVARRTRRSYKDEPDRVISVVAVYRKGDDWDAVRVDAANNPRCSPSAAPPTARHRR